MGYDEISKKLGAYNETIKEIEYLAGVSRHLKEKSVCIDTILPKENLVLSSIGNNARYEKFVEEIADIERQIVELKQRSEQELKQAEELIELTVVPRQRKALRLFYILGMSNDDIALELRCDARSVCRYKSKGIARIYEALYL